MEARILALRGVSSPPTPMARHTPTLATFLLFAAYIGAPDPTPGSARSPGAVATADP